MPENDIVKHDKELTQKIDKLISPGIEKSRERQDAAERLIRKRNEFRKRYGFDKRH